MSEQSINWRRGVPSRIERLWRGTFNEYWIARHRFGYTNYMPLSDAISTSQLAGDSNPHQLVWLSNIDYAVKMASRFIEIDDYSFLDMGCGTGVPALYAYSKLGFRNASGFDIDERFVMWARENAERAGVKGEVKFQNADAKEVTLRDEKTFLFFFNSFGESTLNSVLDNNQVSLEKNRSVICLVNDLLGPAVAARRNTRLLWRSWKRNVSLFQFVSPDILDGAEHGV